MNRTYQAVIVLGLNITPVPGGYAPTTYQDHDIYGMLGGFINVAAAAELWAAGVSTTWVFSTGTSAKTKASYGNDVPTEAAVYSQAFHEAIARLRTERPELSKRPEPQIILEDRSVNTFSNLAENLQIIRNHGWTDVAILSARYHIPRVQALFGMITAKYPLPGVQTAFLQAEDVVTTLLPGVYDQQITEAYASPQAQRRQDIEAQGLADIRSGNYVMGELQLST